MLVSDVSRAFFEAPATRNIAVTLPDEALAEAEKGQGMVGVLKLSVYGTRDAAANFQREVLKMMTAAGFAQSKYNASLYHKGREQARSGVAHGDAAMGRRRDEEKWKEQARGGVAYGDAATGRRQAKMEDISVLIHGDDFVAAGSREDIKQFRQAIAGRFTVKDNLVGSRSDLGELQETRVLNRIIRWTQKGWEYEADQRHAELIVREMGMENAKSVKTPGEDVPSWKLDTEEEYLEGAQATKFRGVVARANYLSADRMDIQYAVK